MTIPITTCLACGQSDDHPKDQTVLPDHSSVWHHMDCHARTSTGCLGCEACTSGPGNGLTGEAFRDYLHSDEHKTHLVTNYSHLPSVAHMVDPAAQTEGEA